MAWKPEDMPKAMELLAREERLRHHYGEELTKALVLIGAGNFEVAEEQLNSLDLMPTDREKDRRPWAGL